MADIIKTFDDNAGGVVDPIRRSQNEDVAKMRASLLSCTNNPALARTALNNITVLRVYHQIARIIKYTELVDKIEDKVYESLQSTIDKANTDSPSTWMMLLEAEERLQRIMIESQKLIQPYLDLQSFDMIDLATTSEEDRPSAIQLNADSRDRLRSSAQQVLLQLQAASGGD